MCNTTKTVVNTTSFVINLALLITNFWRFLKTSDQLPSNQSLFHPIFHLNEPRAMLYYYYFL